MALVTNCAARSFPGLRDDLLCFLGLVGDVRLGWLLLVVLEELRIVIHKILDVAIVRRLVLDIRIVRLIQIDLYLLQLFKALRSVNVSKFLLALQSLHGRELALRLASDFLALRARLAPAARASLLTSQNARRVQMRARTLNGCKIEI